MGSRDDVDRLKAMVEDQGDETVALVLEDYCLMLCEPDEMDEWTDAPPRIGELFAHDGSEQEYCLLDNGAVVLYTPLSDERPHVVVGADLREFLSLLLSIGDSTLGGLGYDWDETVSELESGWNQPEDATEDDLRALDGLKQDFDLAPWPSYRDRLQELQALLPGHG